MEEKGGGLLVPRVVEILPPVRGSMPSGPGMVDPLSVPLLRAEKDLARTLGPGVDLTRDSNSLFNLGSLVLLASSGFKSWFLQLAVVAFATAPVERRDVGGGPEAALCVQGF